MIRYLTRGADQCWHWVTTDWATWARLPHVAGAIVAAGIACGPTTMPPIPTPAPQPLPAVAHPPKEPQRVPGSAFYYPPGALDNGPGRTIDYRRYDVPPPVPVPEPSALAVLALGVGLIFWNRRKRT